MSLTELEVREVRATLAVVVDTAPPGPDWPALITDRAVKQDRRPTPGWRTAVMAALIVLVLIGGFAAVSSQRSDVAAGDPLAHRENGFPHLLIDEPGWQVVRVHETGDLAEYEFRSDAIAAELRIRPASADDVDGLLADRLAASDHHVDLNAFGRQATAVRYAETDDWAVIWASDDQLFELRANPAEDVAQLISILAAMRPATSSEWRDAMPDSAVAPENLSAVVTEMLSGIHLPDGFDGSRLRPDRGIVLFGWAPFLDRYQLGASVAGASACAWIDVQPARTSPGAKATPSLSATRSWARARTATATFSTSAARSRAGRPTAACTGRRTAAPR